MIDCPECDDYQAPSRDTLRNHANAKADHDWGEIKQKITADNREESDNADDEQPDQPVEQDKTSETSENDQQEATDSDREDMVSQEELKKQRAATGEPSGENSQTAPKLDTDQSTQSSGGIPLPVPRSWLVAAAALVALGIVGMWVMADDSETTDDEPPESDGDELDELADGSEGGLI